MNDPLLQQMLMRANAPVEARLKNMEGAFCQLVQAHNSMAQTLGNLIDALQRSPRVREAMAQDVAEREISQTTVPVAETSMESVSDVEGVLAQA